MIYLEDYEGRTVDIYYRTGSGKGEMHVGLAVYMNQMPLTKIKKLLNIIKKSDNPEAVDDFQEYAQKWLSQYEIEQKQLANKCVDAKDKFKEAETTCRHCLAMRGRYKRKSEQYEHFNKLVKSTREEMKKQKMIASSAMSNFKSNINNKDKFEKIIQFIEQGR